MKDFSFKVSVTSGTILVIVFMVVALAHSILVIPPDTAKLIIWFCSIDAFVLIVAGIDMTCGERWKD